MSAPSFAPMPHPFNSSYLRAPWLDTHPATTKGYTTEHRTCPLIGGDTECTILRFPATRAMSSQACEEKVDAVLADIQEWLPLRVATHYGRAEWAVRPNSILAAVDADSDRFFSDIEGGARLKHGFKKDIESLMEKYSISGVPFLVSMSLEMLGRQMGVC